MIAATEWGWNAWAWLVIPLAVYGLTSLTLFAFGRTNDMRNPLTFFFGQIGDTLRLLPQEAQASIKGTTDAGRTFESMGLRDSHHIGRILTHPTDPNIAYVAALGGARAVVFTGGIGEHASDIRKRICDGLGLSIEDMVRSGEKSPVSGRKTATRDAANARVRVAEAPAAARDARHPGAGGAVPHPRGARGGGGAGVDEADY